ncbi:MAG: glycosyltransferase [Gammaproteobacteria bacterium]
MKRVLMIASHFPPMAGSSGVQRTLKFCRYLLDHGWTATVLTVHPRAHPTTSEDLVTEIPKDVAVEHAFCLDTARHLSVKGRYPGFLALPDRWSSWCLGAIPRGMWTIRRLKPQVIWSTYPIATAHLIGWVLKRLSHVPWVADFRDSMTEEAYPVDPRTRRVYRWIEHNTLTDANRCVFTAPGTVGMYADRYPDIPRGKLAMIPNGYDEENFDAARRTRRTREQADGQVVLVHSGLLYPAERDPTSFFKALARLHRSGRISPDKLKVILRATGHDDVYRSLIVELGIDGIVKLASAVGYNKALSEMLEADGLLLFQGPSCNHQIPAKLFEYMRAQRPILALTDDSGDTASVLRSAGVDTIVPIDDVSAIAAGVEQFIDHVRSGKAPVADYAVTQRYSRRAQAAELAALLDDLI